MKMKFRVYDDISKCMKDISFDEIKNYREEDLILSTNSKDANRDEIYLYDIVDNGFAISVIVWDEYGFCLAPLNHYSKQKKYDKLSMYEAYLKGKNYKNLFKINGKTDKEITILGNIFENGDLILDITNELKTYQNKI